MNMQRPMTFKELIQDTVFSSGGIEGIAQELGISASTLYAKINPNDAAFTRENKRGDTHRTHKLWIMEWIQILRKTQDFRSLHKICEEFGFFVLEAPTKYEDMKDTDWIKNVANLMKEAGEAAAMIAESIENDGRIDDQEREFCLVEIGEAMHAIALLWFNLKG